MDAGGTTPAAPAPARAHTSTPRILHRVWVGGPMPTRLQEYGATWKAHHPHWQHRLWGDADLGWLRNRDLYDRAHLLVPADAVGQFRSDLARYEILLHHGGLYVDTDTEVLRCVDQALAGHDAWAAAEDPRWVGNTYLAGRPGHPVFAALVAGIPASVRANPGRRPNVTTGPQYLTAIWHAHGCHVDPPARWYPYSYRDVRQGTVPAAYDGAWAVHHWAHTRRLTGT